MWNNLFMISKGHLKKKKKNYKLLLFETMCMYVNIRDSLR